MKKTQLLLLVFLVCLWANLIPAQAQVVTEPSLPTADQPLLITFNATGTGLEGYTGDVYAHTGVIIQGNSSWQYVIEGWGNNATQPRLTRLGPDLYELHITPSIREFYKVPAHLVISQVALVFRSANEPYSQTRPNIYIDVAQAGLTVSIISPAGMQPIVSPGEVITIEAAANEADSLALFVNQQWVNSTTEANIRYGWTANESGRFDLKAIAYSGTETAEFSTYFFVRPEVSVAELPNGLVNGINYIDDSTVTLVLHDPPAKKEYVFVIADFNDWGVGTDNFMSRTPDGQHFWITITGLTPGKEYAFQYLIDGKLRIADPYTDKILDPSLDNEIRSQGRYPGLIPYPTGKTLHQVSVLQTAREPYQWEHTDFVPPAVEDLVIYELLIRDFLDGNNNTYAMLRDTLAYLQRLGVNAIELMPVTNFQGNLSWGYNPSFFFAPDKYYGPRRELKKLIDTAHGMGMAVIVDMVWNHSYEESPLLRMYFDEQGNRPHDDNPWYSDPIYANPNMNFGYKFDHGSPYFIGFMDRANRHWLEHYNVDGFRFDLTKGFTTRYKGPNDEWGSNFDQERLDNLKRLYDQIKSVKPGAFVILEHLSANYEETMLSNHGMLLWGKLSDQYMDAAMGWVNSSNFSNISYKNRGWSDPHLVGYIESHDEQRLMYKNLTWGNISNPAHNTRDLDIALQRAGQAAAFLFTVPGPKMLWQFGELGYDYDIDFNGRLGVKPVRWDYYDDVRRRHLHDVYASLIHLKTQNEVFRTNDFNLNVAGAMKRIHLNHESNQVTVLGNFDVVAGSITPNFQKTGTWYEFFSGGTIEVTNVNQPITLQPGEYRLYSTNPFPTQGPTAGTQPLPDNTGSMEAYPNPSSTGFYFSWDGDAAHATTLEIFNLQGQHIVNMQMATTSGLNQFFWNGISDQGTTSPAGIYLYRLHNGTKTYGGKLVVH